MSVKDMIKKSVLESGVFDQYNIPSILVALAAALVLGILIFLGTRAWTKPWKNSSKIRVDLLNGN